MSDRPPPPDEAEQVQQIVWDACDFQYVACDVTAKTEADGIHVEIRHKGELNETDQADWDEMLEFVQEQLRSQNLESDLAKFRSSKDPLDGQPIAAFVFYRVRGGGKWR